MNAGSLIATILRNDKKNASYKIALIRSINDVVLGYPHIGDGALSVAIPLLRLAQFWVAYYWPFTNTENSIRQGQKISGKKDISFRPALENLHAEWEKIVGASRASDGFYLVTELQSEHRRRNYPFQLRKAYQDAVTAIANAIQQPIRYAGSGQYSVFRRPDQWKKISSIQTKITCLPGTMPDDLCLIIDRELWTSFCGLSLWIEALCIHEWSLFTEGIANVDRGVVYSLLTDRPDNRRPLTWERNNVEILMMEGHVFECPWTGKILHHQNYDMDHLLPISVYPINELWNIVPADREYNQHIKRDKLPGPERMKTAQPRLITTYNHYIQSEEMAFVLWEDARLRFDGKVSEKDLSLSLTACISEYLETIISNRNLPIF